MQLSIQFPNAILFGLCEAVHACDETFCLTFLRFIHNLQVKLYTGAGEVMIQTFKSELFCCKIDLLHTI